MFERRLDEIPNNVYLIKGNRRVAGHASTSSSNGVGGTGDSHHDGGS